MLFYDRLSDDKTSSPENVPGLTSEPMAVSPEEIRVASPEPSNSPLQENQSYLSNLEPTAASTDETLGAYLMPDYISSPDDIRAYAATLPLPSSPVLSDIDARSAAEDVHSDSPNSIPMSRDPSHASSNTTDDHVDRNDEDCPPPAQPILIKPFIQSHGNDDNSTVENDLTKSPSKLVMV